ncbi:MAG: DUF547 domain-containing protein [Bdellovibrionales bacterium]|nr:DUF547 domain-containing protein [Bdellovibrionales bacterium]
MKLIVIGLYFLTTSVWGFNHDHGAYSKVLKSHVVRKGPQTLVDYKELKKAPADLDSYIVSLGEISKKEFESWSKDQKLATLINGYNAWTLKLITKNYHVTSIKDIGPFYSTPWKIKFISWLGEKVSLDDIEHNIIRKQFKEPRIHFALVCAAIGCPSLQQEPYLPKELDHQLEKASKEFLNDKNKNRAEVTGNKLNLQVSSIFNWYGQDFGTREELIAYIVKGMGLTEIDKSKRVSVSYLDYDWSLNEKK